MNIIRHNLDFMSNIIHNNMMTSKGKGKIPRRGRPVETDNALAQLSKRGVSTLEDARQAGLSQATLSRLVSSGKLLRVEHGLYLHPDSPIDPEVRDLSVACAYLGSGAVIGGMTALAHYGLIEEVPRRIWVIVPQERKTTNSLYRCIRTQTSPRIGVTEEGAYRITNLERTLVEALRYASKIGLRVALRAVRTAILQGRTTEKKILNQAKKLGLENHVVKYWEAIVPESLGIA